MSATAIVMSLLISFICLQGAIGLSLSRLPGISLNLQSSTNILNTDLSLTTDEPSSTPTGIIDYGNIDVFGDITNNDFQLEQMAEDERKRTKSQDLNLGNIFVANDFDDSEVEVTQFSEGNFGTSGSSGDVNTGNFVFVGDLSGNRRLMFKEDPFIWLQ